MDDALEPGQQLGGYRIEALLGRGGMGEVYRAEHLTMGRQAALKVLAPELAGDQEFRQRFLRESRIAAQLEHPNIVPIYDTGDAGGRLYIAMRYVDGSDLRALLRSGGRLDPDRALSLLGQVAGALDAAHDEGVVHRDVKPANILVESRPAGEHVYLCDFGLGISPEAASQLTRSGETLGTAAYMAPEHAYGETVDGRTDGYALGCVLFECLTGKPPYARDTVVATIAGHLNAPVPAVSDARPELGGALDMVFERALAKNPADRYPSCQALLTAAWEAFTYGVAAGVPVWEPPGFELDGGSMAGRVPPAAGGARAPRRPRAPREEPRGWTRRVPLVVGALALAVAVAGGTLAATELGAPPQPDLAAGVTTITAPTATTAPTTTVAPTTTAAPTTAAPATTAPAAAAPATTAAPTTEPPSTQPPKPEPDTTKAPDTTKPPDTTEASPDPPASPVDDSFSVKVSGYRGCRDPASRSSVEFVDYGPGVTGNGKSNDDYVQVNDRCADGDGVKAWAWLNGQRLGSRYNGDGEGSTVIWDPLKAHGNVGKGDLVRLRVCIVNGKNDPSPSHCRSKDRKSVDG